MGNYLTGRDLPRAWRLVGSIAESDESGGVNFIPACRLLAKLCVTVIATVAI